MDEEPENKEADDAVPLLTDQKVSAQRWCPVAIAGEELPH
jgi:hypothetical protein